MINNVMIDLETMGVGVHAPLFQIGAVTFGAAGVVDEFKVNVDLVEVLLLTNKEVQYDTVDWWRQQELPNREDVTRLDDALREFSSWMESLTHQNSAIWANSPSFDCVILADHYHQVGRSAPWSYKQERDMRTLIDIKDPDHKLKPVMDGTVHDALDDARYQAEWVRKILYVVE